MTNEPTNTTRRNTSHGRFTPMQSSPWLPYHHTIRSTTGLCPRHSANVRRSVSSLTNTLKASIEPRTYSPYSRPFSRRGQRNGFCCDNLHLLIVIGSFWHRMTSLISYWCRTTLWPPKVFVMMMVIGLFLKPLIVFLVLARLVKKT